MLEKSLSIIFFGSPEFALPSFNALLDSQYEVAAVVTQPDKPKGRGKHITPTPVAHVAQKKNIPVIKSSKITPDVLEKIKSYNCPLGVVVAYGALLPQELLDIFPMGVLNIHPSLLPKYRGASPLQGPILAGDKKTGVSIMLLDSGLDSGPILLQESIQIEPHDTVKTIHNVLAKKGALLLLQAIDGLVDGTLVSQDQDHEKATFTKKIKKQDGEIDWTKGAENIDRHIRAYTGWPGAYTKWKGLQCVIHKAHIAEVNPVESPGTVFIYQNDVCIATSNGALVIDEMQLQNKQKNAPSAFIKGHQDFIGSILPS
ncbi:MAG: methionyl-tRNA formyltransferase [Patescibacteria group bacterium]